MTLHEHRSQNDPTLDSASTMQDELAWTAFLYSVDELPADEATRFETRLETDASAQAALAQAVALSAGVQLAEEAVPARRVLAPITAIGTDAIGNGAFGRRVAGWMLLATAASVALWFAASQPRNESGRDTARGPVGEAQHALAVAWVAGQDMNEGWASEDVVIVDEMTSDDDLQAELAAYPVIEEPTAPDWLIAALVDAQSSPVRGEN